MEVIIPERNYPQGYDSREQWERMLKILERRFLKSVKENALERAKNDNKKRGEKWGNVIARL